ncbi:MAG: hypothetical protein ABIQ16_09300, partial [Polyangiaceae bacterium]
MIKPRIFRTTSAFLAVLALSCGSSVELAAPAPPPQFRTSTDPTSLGEINERVSNLLVDGERIYWTGYAESGTGPLSLRSCAKLDCSNTLVTYGATRNGQPFAVENGQIFWLDDSLDYGLPACGALLSCDIAGCIGGPRQVDSVPIANCYSAAAFSSDAV